MKSFDELIQLSNDFKFDFHLEKVNTDGEFNLKLSNHMHPWSLKEIEAKIIYDIILKNDLKYGFEIATAFGISACVIGQAIFKTKGKLVTMDSYVEEYFNYSQGYDINTRMINTNLDSDGYLMAKKLVDSLGLNEEIVLEVGWSPDDTTEIINKNFKDNKLDFAFIDGGHTIEQIDADVKSIIPCLNYDSIIFFHDHPQM